MGNILLWLGRGLYLGGGAIIGVMFEKISSWVAGLLPPSVKVTDKSGGLAAWFIAAVAIGSGIVLYIVTKAITGKKKIFTLALMAAAFAADAYLFGAPVVGLVTASLLFTIDPSSTQTKTITYLPEFIMFNIGTVPSSFQITMVGDGVTFALDGTGITNLNGLRCMGTLKANTYMFAVADGYIGKNATFKIANAHAGDLDVYGFSNSRGSGYITYNMATALANASLTIDRFWYAAFPSAAATDSFTVTWADGTSDDLTRFELESYIAYKQQVADTRYNLDNFQREIQRIQFRGAAEQSVYYVRPQETGRVNQAL